MSVEDLRGIFERMADETGWNVDGDLLWGYFFTDPAREPLDRAAPLLQAQGYRIVKVYQSEEDDESDALWWLHVERVEVHSPESLFARGERLVEFARHNGIRDYDGWDVGPAAGEAAGSA